MVRLVRLLVLAALTGGAAGLAAWAFLRALTWATDTRVGHGWLVWVLPVAGLVIGVVYTYLAGSAAGGTTLAVREAHRLHEGVPARMAPLVFGCAFAGHLCGASVGREGAAVQMSAAMTDSGARLLRLDHRDRQVLLGASLAAGFGAIVGTPVAAVLFATQLTRRRRLTPVLTCVVAAVVGDVTVRALGQGSTYPHLARPDWTFSLPFKLLIAGALIGVAGRLYRRSGDAIGAALATRISWPPLRLVIGGVATIVLALCAGRDYLGLSIPLLDTALAGSHVDWWVPVLKLVFTVTALGSGFVGGEVIPLFVIGATLGSALAGPLGVSPALLAACGLSTLFTTAAQVSLTGVVIAIELFGWNAAIPVAVVAASAWMTIGRHGLYLNRGETVGPPVGAPSPSR